MIKKLLASVCEWGRFRKSFEGAPVMDLPTKPSNLSGQPDGIKSMDELKQALSPNRKPLTFKTEQAKGGIRVALDESVGNAMARRIEELGYKIVCRAGPAELDTVWLKRALDQRALFIVSPDLDIPSLIEKENYPMIWIDFLFASNVNPTIQTQTRDVKRGIWVQYVHDRIQAKLKFFNKEFGGDVYAKGNNP
jgi:hypothetical protein